MIFTPFQNNASSELHTKVKTGCFDRSSSCTSERLVVDVDLTKKTMATLSASSFASVESELCGRAGAGLQCAVMVLVAGAGLVGAYWHYTTTVQHSIHSIS